MTTYYNLRKDISGLGLGSFYLGIFGLFIAGIGILHRPRI